MLSNLSTYTECTEQSEQIYWDLREATEAIDLDFSKPFLPQCLVDNSGLTFLSDNELLLFNQIHGHAYAHLFLFVEEFIISQILKQVAAHPRDHKQARRSLMRFCQEEIKHQALFKAFKTQFKDRFPVHMNCATVEDKDQVAAQIIKYSPLSVMLLISMLEWITQTHYLSCFSTCEEDIDQSFMTMFKLHWIEEEQHAKIDSIEIDLMAVQLSQQEIETAVRDFLTLCKELDFVLQQQANFDVLTLQQAIKRNLTVEESQAIIKHQHTNYQWMFVGCGLEHKTFLGIIEQLAPGLMDEVEKVKDQFS